MAHTIGDSIIELADKYTVNHSSENYINNKLMLEEFKAIVVDKACEWLDNNQDGWLDIEKFRKVMDG